MELLAGFSLFCVSAVFNGVMALPLRIRRRFEVENTWTLGNFFAMVILPLLTAFAILPEWVVAIQSLELTMLGTLLVFGFGWGIGSVAYSIGVSTVGLGIGIATIMGTVVAVGAGIPLLRRWDQLPTDARVIVLAGICVALVGVALIGRAGAVRERNLQSVNSEGTTGSHNSVSTGAPVSVYVVGLAWCLFSGLTSACANLGFDFAAPLDNTVLSLGANQIFASLFRWIPLFWGGYLAIIVFSGSKLVSRGSWKNFFGAGAARDSILAVGLGVCHFGTLLTYGMGAVYLGELGTSVGFAVAMSMALIVANFLGFLTGEWKKAPGSAVRTLAAGLAVLILAIVILAAGNNLVAG